MSDIGKWITVYLQAKVGLFAIVYILIFIFEFHVRIELFKFVRQSPFVGKNSPRVSRVLDPHSLQDTGETALFRATPIWDTELIADDPGYRPISQKIKPLWVAKNRAKFQETARPCIYHFYFGYQNSVALKYHNAWHCHYKIIESILLMITLSLECFSSRNKYLISLQMVAWISNDIKDQSTISKADVWKKWL